MGTSLGLLCVDVLDRLNQEHSLPNIEKAKRWINQRYYNVCSQQKWPFLKKEAQIITLAEYTTGTIATDGTTTITGTSTVWTKAMTGRKFLSDAWDEIYKIAQWSSATSVELNNNFLGDDETAGTYTIFQDEYWCPSTWRHILSIRESYGPRILDKLDLDTFRSSYHRNYPGTADPTSYAYFETKDITKINITAEHTGTFTVGEIVAGGTSSAYGTVREVGTNQYLNIEILYGTFTNGEILTGADSSATTTVYEPYGYKTGNVGGNLKVLFGIAPYRALTYDCEVIVKPDLLSSDGDDMVIPDEYKDIIVFGACADYAMMLDKQAKVSYFETLFRKRLFEMTGDLIPKDEGFPRISTRYERKAY